jgi:intracellular sulfur oxidation DsrE/DsrF family protein
MMELAMNRRTILGAVAAALALAPMALQSAMADEKKPHRLALHVDQNDPAVMNLALNNAMNVYEYYSARDEEVAIEIVAYGQGLHMLREDTSPVKDKIKALRAKVANTTFSACGNTMGNMEKTEAKKVPLIAEATVVPAGVVRLMELQEQGWSYVRP